MKKLAKIGKQKGFTIIELMISMTILSFIALFVYQNTTRSFQLRENLSAEGDFYSSLRVVFDTFSRDITHVYSPQAMSLPGDLGKPPAVKPGQQPEFIPEENYAFWASRINKNGVRPSRFVGEENKLSFVANSHLRLFKDSAECEFAKITYSFEEDKLSAQKGQMAIVKTEDADVFAFEERKSEKSLRYILISNVKSIKFRYLDGEKDQWLDRWDSTSSDHKNKYPSMVELEVVLPLPKSQNTFSVFQRYRPELQL